ncbi:MAG: disulfide oxidoreductase [Sulfurospirillaceae bacterium]|jgi:disulfide bond formation protein DsbB|nr:disulfide oxidoreductase [Sulfurospirillaceae bacterium]MCK9546646.1 disulfide oxidoreductase [Sulfurospirillaceae bacterium]NLN00169.1 disulfide bond formation protein B [Campylobacteraceae bacterium]
MTKKSSSFIILAWSISLIATLGSLFFSEVLNFIPCTLCWYQRVMMYPIVFLLAQAIILNKHSHGALFSLPLAATGVLMAFYHVLLQHGVISESVSPCGQGIPCSAKYIEWFGFISIPALSLIAFFLIITILIKVYKDEK